MILEFDKSFSKMLDKISNSFIEKRVEDIINDVEKATSIHELKNIKKLFGYKNYYRIRIGDYRLGFEIVNKSSIRFLVIAHRKEIYRTFP